MKNKNIIYAVLLVAVIAGLMWWGKLIERPVLSVSGSADESQSSLTATEKIYDFKTITMKNGNVSKDFTFTNSTGKDITIRGVETSCMCTAAFLVEPDGSTKGPFGMPGMGGMTTTNVIVKAGESRVLRVVYNPNAHGPAGVGPIDRFVTIIDDAGGTIRFEIKALVTP